MGDFYQGGSIATLHNFKQLPTEELERRLVDISKTNKMRI